MARVYRSPEVSLTARLRSKPLSASSIRATHWILSAALTRAVRWRWIGRNPVSEAERPGAVHSNPSPPTPAEARPAAHCRLGQPRLGHLRLARTLFVRTALKLVAGQLVRSTTKTTTSANTWNGRTAEPPSSTWPGPAAYVFTLSPDGSTPLARTRQRSATTAWPSAWASARR